LFLVVAALAGPTQGGVSFVRTEADLGFIYRDEPQKLVYEFENTSDETLRILEIEPSCDCTTAQALPDPVPPRASGKVLVFFDPMGYEGRGSFSEYVRLRFSDATMPEVVLRYTADVGIGPEPEPRSLSFGRICRGQSDTLSFDIKPTPGASFQVLDACSDTSCVIVEDMGENDKGIHRFRVIATNREGCGRLASLVSVSTSDSLREIIRVPITVSLIGHIIIEPDIVAFGPTLPGAYVKQAVKIYAVQGEKFSIPEVTSMIDQIEPVVTPIDETSCELRLKVREDAPPGRVTGKIILQPGCPAEPSLVIKVTGYVRSNRR
jgi:hypothetical protein